MPRSKMRPTIQCCGVKPNGERCGNTFSKFFLCGEHIGQECFFRGMLDVVYRNFINKCQYGRNNPGGEALKVHMRIRKYFRKDKVEAEKARADVDIFEDAIDSDSEDEEEEMDTGEDTFNNMPAMEGGH